jgi:5'-deoxynucleotidase YfbR-like HD superfamily hydrolase
LALNFAAADTIFGFRSEMGTPMARAPRQQTASRAAAAPRAWQRMLSGRRLDLLDPSPLDVEIEDIAHGLARVARWNGQTVGAHAFSVAQHSLLVEELCRKLAPDWGRKRRLMALLHDAAEYVIGDMISPFKAALGLDYKGFEAKLEAAIHVRFGLPAHTPAAVKAVIKRADTICAYFEAVQLAGFSEAEAKRFFGAPPRTIQLKLAPRPTAMVQEAFLKRFRSLIDPA